MNETELSELRADIKEIKDALIGSVSSQSVGLLEEARKLRREVDDLKHARELHDLQIREAIQFKSDAKKVVAGIAIVVPFIFEIIKLGVVALWEMFKVKS
jgi:hypothetical protein